MKRLLMTVVLMAGAAASADEARYVDPNPFADYGAAMQSTKEHPLAVNWSQANDGAIAAATADDALAGCVASRECATALLAKLRPAYESDPLVLTQVAAVTQWVMLPDPWYCLFWDGPHAAGRAVWTAALTRKIASTNDEYIRTFCRQQLDLCK